MGCFRRPLLSIDTNNNLLILSSLNNRTDELLIEQLPLDDFQNGFMQVFNFKPIKQNIPKNVKLDDGMRNCQQLSSFVYCCVITANDNTSFRDKGTHCFRQRSTDLFDHFYKKNMQMTQTWQTLSDDDTVVLLQNMAGGYAMLDTKYGIMLKFENPSQIKFCANPIYQAIIQFNNAYTNIKWQLQVTYTTTNGINDNNIYIVDSVDLITDQQIAMICSPFNIDIYMISSNVLVHYAIDLPKIDGETLIGNYF
ncbi:unnamed protein product [Onchocerca ochengi]|uniref:Uncharacterized protein n=1 Tax=Onchocerca ochengi TaxID=42157 RepID=A0A182EQ78_ONCOC|nr:unnamed protein product [Onchocerca ochengi]